MVPFYTKFPELADTETRVFTTAGDPNLPDGQYGFMESFCDEPNCDCHRVLINVVSNNNPGKFLATINFGWKSKEFYLKFLTGFTLGIPKDNPKGPYLDPLNPQSEYSSTLLEIFTWLLEDQDYVDRLERHYLLFKQAIKKKVKSGNIRTNFKKIENNKKKRQMAKKQKKKNR